MAWDTGWRLHSRTLYTAKESKLVASTTIVFGLLLILLGVGGYFGTARHSLTALIPAIPGVLFILLGMTARNPRYRMHAMHVAAALALIGFLAMIRGGLVPLVRWAGGTRPELPAAVTAKSIMAGVMLGSVVLCVCWLITARPARLAPLPGPP